MTTVTIADFRSAGVCRDARHWFAKHNLDWRSFVLAGIAPDELRATNDHQDTVEFVISHAIRREAQARHGG